MSQTNISELSVDEFKRLVREVVEQTITDIFTDPDEGLELREEVKDYLEASLKAKKGTTVSARQVAENLDLEW